MKILFASVAALALLVTPALADCAASLTKIEEAMKTATVDDATKANVQTLASEAKTANDNGDAAGCETKATQALALLGM